MNRSAYRVLPIVALAACSAIEFAAGQSEAKSVKADVIEKISAKALWHSQEPVIYQSGGVVISYWGADVEDQPMAGGWVSPGIVMAGLGDLDETPVAVRLWTKESDVFLKDESLAESDRSEGAVALFGTPGGVVRLRFRAVASGEVFVDGVMIGTVKPAPTKYEEYERPNQ